MTTTREHLAAFEALIEEHITLLGCTNDTARAAQLALCAQSAEPVQGEAVEVAGWRVTGNGGLTVAPQYPVWAVGDSGLTIQPLYTSPAKPDAELVALLTRVVDYYAEGEGELKCIAQDCRAKLAELQK
jgi:hypothetical protein